MRARSGTRPTVRMLGVVATAGMLLLAGCGSGSGKAGALTVTLHAGGTDPNDKNIAVLAFLPSVATVQVGSKVTWKVPGPEPHTVTFVPAGSKPPLPTDADATKAIATPGAYDPTHKVSSGLLGTPGGPNSFTLTFRAAGSYTYYCAIHPNMVGTLKVVAGTGDKQSALAAKGKAEARHYEEEGRAAKQTLLSSVPKPKTNPDGSKTWTVEMGTSTQHTAVLAFSPVPVNIKKGDKVVFVNNSTEPHTASFAGKTTLPQDPESSVATRATGKSPLTLNATAFFNTGWLPPNAPPGSVPLAARSFTFTVPTAGTFNFVCLLHAPSGQTGSIVAS